MRKIKLILGASILLLASGQVNAGILLEGAEVWEYSVRGSATSYQDDSIVDIFGTMLIDTTVRDWDSPHSPRQDPYCNQFADCQNFFHILTYGLLIGNEVFFGGGPFCNACGTGDSNVNALYFDTEEYPYASGSGTFRYGATDWNLDGFGDYSWWTGQNHLFFHSDGTRISASDIFQEAPSFIEMKGFDVASSDRVYMNLTRVARVPEPAMFALFGIGLLGVIGFTKRRKVA